MIGPQHYTEAENLLVMAKEQAAAGDTVMAELFLRQADVHAKLALAAATGVSGYESMGGPDSSAWTKVAGVQI